MALATTQANTTLGTHQLFRGKLVLGVAKQVRNEDEWDLLRPWHRAPTHTLPYNKTYALPIVSAHHITPTPFVHPRGAVNIVKYRRA